MRDEPSSLALAAPREATTKSLLSHSDYGFFAPSHAPDLPKKTTPKPTASTSAAEVETVSRPNNNDVPYQHLQTTDQQPEDAKKSKCCPKARKSLAATSIIPAANDGFELWKALSTTQFSLLHAYIVLVAYILQSLKMNGVFIYDEIDGICDFIKANKRPADWKELSKAKEKAAKAIAIIFIAFGAFAEFSGAFFFAMPLFINWTNHQIAGIVLAIVIAAIPKALCTILTEGVGIYKAIRHYYTDPIKEKFKSITFKQIPGGILSITSAIQDSILTLMAIVNAYDIVHWGLITFLAVLSLMKGFGDFCFQGTMGIDIVEGFLKRITSGWSSWNQFTNNLPKYIVETIAFGASVYLASQIAIAQCSLMVSLMVSTEIPIIANELFALTASWSTFGQQIVIMTANLYSMINGLLHGILCCMTPNAFAEHCEKNDRALADIELDTNGIVPEINRNNLFANTQNTTTHKKPLLGKNSANGPADIRTNGATQPSMLVTIA